MQNFLQASEERMPPTVRKYCSMLMAVAKHDSLQLYSDEMAADPEGYGIIRTETLEGWSYTMIAGMEDQPVRGLSQEQQAYYAHWVEQGFPQEEELLTPLMMLRKNENPEEAKKGVVLKQQKEQRNREATEQGSDLSSLEQRSQNPAGIKISTSSDNTSNISIVSLDQAQENLHWARQEITSARQYFDSSYAQWTAFKKLETLAKIHTDLQLQLTTAFNNWHSALARFQQAQAAAYDAWSRQDPSHQDLHQKVIAIGAEVHRAAEIRDALLFQVQMAYKNYCFAQQISAQQQLVPGVDYTLQLNQAQSRANQAAAELKKWEQLVLRKKSEKPNPSKKNGSDLSKESANEVSQKFIFHDVEDSLAEQKAQAIITSEVANLLHEIVEKCSLEPIIADTLIQEIAEKSMQEALLEKQQQARWKKVFSQMVEHVKQLKETVATDLSKKLLNEVSQEFIFHHVETSLAEQKTQAIITSEAANLLHEMVEKCSLEPIIADTLIQEIVSDLLAKKNAKKITKKAKQEVLLEKQQSEEELILKKQKHIFNQLFSGAKTTDDEKEKLKQESRARMLLARKQRIDEMEKFCAERQNLSQKKEHILAQYFYRSYTWCSDTLQLVQDWRRIQIEAGKRTEKFFADQGRNIIDVPTTEYAWKNGLIAEELYNEMVAKRRQEQAATAVLPREQPSSKELGYFEQIPLLLESPVLARFIASFFLAKGFDSERESDQRALDYFKEIKKPHARLLEFWKKSAEIEEQLKKERREKEKKFIEQFPNSEQKQRHALKEWNLQWPERLQQERDQKKREALERDLFGKEEERQKIVQAMLDQKATEEAKRQAIEEELIRQEAIKKAAKRKKKKGKM